MNGRYMLDTDTVSYALRDVGNVRAGLVRHVSSQICVSALTAAELRLGANLRQSRRIESAIDVFLADIEVVPFDAECSRHFGVVAAELRRQGVPIGEFDTLIAAHALALDATLVTNNLKHFSRVRGLRAESWI